MKHIPKSILLLAILVLSGLNIFLGSQSRDAKANFNQKLDQINYELNSLQDFGKEIEHRLLEQYKADPAVLPRDIQLNSWDRSEKSLSDLAKEGPWLILRFSEHQCQTCVNLEKENLRKIKEEMGIEKILLWGNFIHPNGAYMYYQTEKLIHPLYDVPISTIPLQEESLDRPYYFVLDQDLKAKNVFIPDQFLQDLSHKYLKVISEKYFSHTTL